MNCYECGANSYTFTCVCSPKRITAFNHNEGVCSQWRDVAGEHEGCENPKFGDLFEDRDDLPF